MKKHLDTVSRVALLFLGWRVILFVLSAVAPKLLIYKPSFPYAYDMLPKYGLPQWLYSWANFDGVHYLTIVEKGYLGTGLIQAFFPLYPLLVRLVNFLLGNSLLSGVILSTCCALLACHLFYYLVSLFFSPQIAWKSLWLLLLFPTSFFLGAVYAEGLFLSLVFAAFIFAKKKQWLWAGIMAGFASATRVVGIFFGLGACY